MIDHFPSNWDWWVVNFCSFVIMAVLSEYLCIRSEMKVIKLDHSVHLDDDDVDTDSDLEEGTENQSLLMHQINKLNQNDNEQNTKVHAQLQSDDQSFDVRIV